MGIQLVEMKKPMKIFVHQTLQKDMRIYVVLWISGFDQDLPIEIKKSEGAKSKDLEFQYLKELDGQEFDDNYSTIKVEALLEYRDKIMIRVKDQREEKSSNIAHIACCWLQYIDADLGIVMINSIMSITVFICKMIKNEN